MRAGGELRAEPQGIEAWDTANEQGIALAHDGMLSSPHRVGSDAACAAHAKVPMRNRGLTPTATAWHGIRR
jgi:hypothetical protein